MKSHFLQILFALGAAVALATSSQAATYRIVAHIPFPFHVGAQTFQPGEYVVESPVRSEVQYLISAATGYKVAALMGNNAVEAAGHARLVFRDYGDSKYLGEIWAVDGYGTKLPESKVERTEHKRWESNEVPLSPAGTD